MKPINEIQLDGSDDFLDSPLDHHIDYTSLKQRMEAVGVAEAAFKVARYRLFKNLPHWLIELIAADLEMAWNFAQAVDFKGVPKIIYERIATSRCRSRSYYEKLGGKKVPACIKKTVEASKVKR